MQGQLCPDYADSASKKQKKQKNDRRGQPLMVYLRQSLSNSHTRMRTRGVLFFSTTDHPSTTNYIFLSIVVWRVWTDCLSLETTFTQRLTILLPNAWQYYYPTLDKTFVRRLKNSEKTSVAFTLIPVCVKTIVRDIQKQENSDSYMPTNRLYRRYFSRMNNAYEIHPYLYVNPHEEVYGWTYSYGWHDFQRTDITSLLRIWRLAVELWSSSSDRCCYPRKLPFSCQRKECRWGKGEQNR